MKEKSAVFFLTFLAQFLPILLVEVPTIRLVERRFPYPFEPVGVGF